MKRFLIFAILLLSVLNLPAPTVQVAGTATANYFLYWVNGSSVATNSALYQSGGFVGANTLTPLTRFHVSETLTNLFRGLTSSQHTTATNEAQLNLRKSRGTDAASTGIVTGDGLGSIHAWGHDNTGWLNMAGIDFLATGTIGANRIPTEIRMYTATDAATSVKTPRVTINNAGFVGIGTTNPITLLHVAETNTTEPRGLTIAQYNTGTNGARLGFHKARGTQEAPTTVVTGDNIGIINAWAYDSANYLNMAGIEFASIGTIAATRVPTEMRFYTATDVLPSVKTLRMTIGANGLITSAAGIAISSPGNITLSAGASIGWTGRGILEFTADGVGLIRNNAGTGFTSLQFGPDAATPSNVSLKSGSGSGTDKNGGNIQINPGISTGAGVSGTFSVWTAGQSSTGAGLNTLTNRFEISALGAILFPTTVTAAGTTGGKVINKPSGRVNIAAGGTSIIITNSLATANSLAFAAVGSNDATSTIKNVVPGAGIITVTITAAATAETPINWFVINQ